MKRTITSIISTALIISSGFGQNVGIGTNIPLYPLDVLGNSSDLVGIRSSVSNTALIVFDGIAAGIVGAVGALNNRMTITDSNGQGIVLRSGGDWLRVTSAGRVGIAIQAPLYTLDVNGNVANAMRLYNSISGNTRMLFEVASGKVGTIGSGASKFTLEDESGNGIAFRSGGEERMTINSNGRIGLGTTNPQSSLHVYNGNDASLSSSGGYLLLGNPAGINLVLDNNEILARNNGAAATLNLNIEGGNIVLGPSGNGNTGIAISSPTERLHIGSGNIRLDNSTGGIMLNGADRPFITRGFEPFTSGVYTGVGRWGLFMEPTKLTFGIPNVIDRGFEFASYETNSTRNTLLNITRTGRVTRPATNNIDLLPICIGSVGTNAGIRGGTGNFTITRNVSTGVVLVTIDGISFNRNSYAVLVTCFTGDNENSHKAYAVVTDTPDGKIDIRQYNDWGNSVNQAFYFVVYKL